MPIYKKLSAMRMMLVEDDEMLRDSLSLFFRTKGCRLSCYGSAEEAQPAVEAERPDIVISDNWLPGADGLTFLRCVAERRPESIRILISAYPSLAVAEEARRAGVDAFILKPFSAADLERVLASLVPVDPGDDCVASSHEAGP